MERLVVVGGDAAGMSAAAAARRRRTRAELEILAFERGTYTSYAACGIPYFVGDLVHDADALIARSPEEHRRLGIDMHTRHEVTAIDTASRTVTVLDLDAHQQRVEAYDQLVVATGSTASHPPIAGAEAAGVFGVQHLEEAVALRRAVDDELPERAVVVGGGYIGIEMAEALVRRGSQVTLVESGPVPMPALDHDMCEIVIDAMRGLGIELHLDERVTEFEVGDGRVRAVTTADDTYEADLVVLGVGSRPNARLAEAAGLAIGPTGGIVTDVHQRTPTDGVFAAGDCVETRHLVTGQPVAIALGTHANKQGRVVGVNATGGDAVFPGVIGTAVSKVCEYEVARTGLNEGEAEEAGFDAFPTTIESTSRAQYYPDTRPVRVKLVTQTGTGRLLGAQVIGREGAAKRIDVLATCIWNEMHVDEIISLDLGYAPPLSPVWDPVLTAARVAAGHV